MSDPLKDFLEPTTHSQFVDGEPIILVEGGNIFDGSFDHWEKCFFKFEEGASYIIKMQEILEYCQHQGWSVEYIWKQ